MIGKAELRSHQDMSTERWISRNFVLGSIFAGALLVMALVGATMAPQPRVDLTDQSGIAELSASRKGSDTALELMSKASDKLPVENWEPAF